MNDWSGMHLSNSFEYLYFCLIFHSSNTNSMLVFAARDIQAWEYIPLGPFLGKSFGKS